MQAQVRVKSSLGQISKHHATVQIKRERYNSRREKNPEEILKDFFHDGSCTVHARFGPWRDASYMIVQISTGFGYPTVLPNIQPDVRYPAKKSRDGSMFIPNEYKQSLYINMKTSRKKIRK